MSRPTLESESVERSQTPARQLPPDPGPPPQPKSRSPSPEPEPQPVVVKPEFAVPERLTIKDWWLKDPLPRRFAPAVFNLGKEELRGLSKEVYFFIGVSEVGAARYRNTAVYDAKTQMASLTETIRKAFGFQ